MKHHFGIPARLFYSVISVNVHRLSIHLLTAYVLTRIVFTLARMGIFTRFI